MIPVPRQNVESEVVEGEVLLYHPQQTQALYLNASAAVIWGLCDGVRTIDDMVALLEEAFPAAKEMVAADVRKTIAYLQDGGVIDLR